MQNEKIQIVLGDGVKEAEVTLREGAAVKYIDPKPPVQTELSGVIGAPLEYLAKRVETGQFAQERSHLIVDREEIMLTLVINEDNWYERGKVEGALRVHPMFKKFGINTGKVWTPVELGKFFKMSRAFFPDRNENMKLVSHLMNFTGTVNSRIERSVKESGDRADSFVQVVNSNLPPSFVLRIPIFKGMPAETVEVETFAQIDGREVSFTLISPGANQTVEEIRDHVIDEQLKQIVAIAPRIAIIEV